MKVIRIAALAFALCAGMTSIAAAQGQVEPKEQGQGGMGGWLLKDIKLTDAQKEKVKAIREKYLPQQLELRKVVQATGTPPDEATRAKMIKLQQDQADEIRSILTPDQYKTFDHNLHELKERMERGKGGE
ncbi:MAG TPA: Spy/CpxP family protein refolding chaperone [Gemmatimonadaceae bacterium]|nr:Spy/CpxP family protein refolding chaperone [Gemmatimonadaceae bacterium]